MTDNWRERVPDGGGRHNEGSVPEGVQSSGGDGEQTCVRGAQRLG